MPVMTTGVFLLSLLAATTTTATPPDWWAKVQPGVQAGIWFPIADSQSEYQKQPTAYERDVREAFDADRAVAGHVCAWTRYEKQAGPENTALRQSLLKICEPFPTTWSDLNEMKDHMLPPADLKWRHLPHGSFSFGEDRLSDDLFFPAGATGPQYLAGSSEAYAAAVEAALKARPLVSLFVCERAEWDHPALHFERLPQRHQELRRVLKDVCRRFPVEAYVAAFQAAYPTPSATTESALKNCCGAFTYSHGESERPSGISSAPDGGWFVSQDATRPGSQGISVVRAASSGTKSWERLINRREFNTQMWAGQISSNAAGFVAVPGATKDYGEVDDPAHEEVGSDLLVSLLDPAGKLVWSRLVRTPFLHQLATTSISEAGDVYVATYAFSVQQSVSMLFHFSPQGSLLWSRNLLLSGDDAEATSVRSLRDGGVVVSVNAEDRGWLLNFDRSGNVRWQRGFASEIRAVTELRNGTLLIVGKYNKTAWIAQLTGTGEPGWQLTANSDFGHTSGAEAVTQRADGSIVVAGQLSSDNPPVTDVWVAPLDVRGTMKGITQFSGQKGLTSHRQTWVTSSRGRSLLLFSSGAQAGTASLVVPLNEDGSTQASCPSLVSSMKPLIFTKRDPLAPARTEVSVESGSWTAFPFPAVVFDPRSTSTILCGISESGDATAAAKVAAPDPAPIAANPSPVGQARPAAVSTTTTEPDDEIVVMPGPEVTAVARKQLARRVAALLLQRHFQELENMANLFRRTRASFASGARKLPIFYGGFSAETSEGLSSVPAEKVLALLAEWQKAMPASVTPAIARATILDALSWEARGGGYAPTVTEEGWTTFEELSTAALAALDGVSQRPADDAYYYQLRMSIRNAAEGAEKIRDDFERAVAIDPGDFGIYASYLNKLRPQWGGSLEAEEKFARTSAQRTKEQLGDALYAWLSWTVWKNHGEAMFAKGLFSWEKIRAGSWDIDRLYPGSSRNTHWFMYLASRAQDKDTASKLVTRPEFVWNLDGEEIWGSKAAFDSAVAWASSGKHVPWIERKNTAAVVPGAGLGTVWQSQFVNKWPALLLHNRTGSRLVGARIGFVAAENGSRFIVTAVNPNVISAKSPTDSFRDLLTEMDLVTAGGATAPIARVANAEVFGTPNHQAVLLETGKLPSSVQVLDAHPLNMNSPQRPVLYVAGCKVSATACEQQVFAADLEGASGDGAGVYYLSLGMRDLPGSVDIIGGPIIDESGFVVGVVTRVGPEGKKVVGETFTNMRRMSSQ